MLIVEFLSQPLWQRLGLTLVHFLWQGLAVAVLVGAFVRVFRLKHGNARYGAYLLAFIAMIACPVVTFTAIDITISPDIELVTGAESVKVVDSSPYTALPASDIVPEAETPRPAIPTVANSIPLGQRISDWLNVSMPWILVIWMVGVIVLSVRLLMGFVGVYRWRHHLEPLPERLVQRIASLSEGLGMRRFSRVFISPTVLQAMAVGYLRPMVLLPAAMVTQMQPEMLEAVIAHELAHIRRFDLWVNLIQRVTETLLFYHPAVWWLSNCIRRERELCCDELAVKATGQRLTYATTLESVGRAKVMAKPPVLAAGLGRDNKPTLGRVRHILGLTPAQRNCPFWLAGVITVLFLASLVIPTTLALTNRSDEKLNDFERVVVEGIRANRNKFECGYLAWSSKQITTRFSDSNRPATDLAGEYELWWDGSKKIATKYVRDEVHRDPEGNFRVEKGQGGTSYDGGVLSWKPDFHSDNWLGPEFTRWRGVASRDWMILRESNMENIRKDWSVIDANGVKLIRCKTKNMNDETSRGYGSYSIRDYDPSKGYGLVNEEWYDPDGNQRMKHTVKMLEVIPGGWFPVEVDFKSFAITDGKVYSHKHCALDIERCSFNDKSALPARIFKGAVDKQLKYQKKLQKYLAMELERISDVKEAVETDKVKRGAREAIEKFVTAAMAGDFEKARQFADPDKAPYDQVEDMPEVLKGQNLWIMAVVADDFDAIGVSSVVDDHEGTMGPLVFFLDRKPQDGRDNWWVHDIDMETPDSAEGELKKFLEKHPKAKKVPYENKPDVQVEGIYRIRHFVRLVSDDENDRITFEGEELDYNEFPENLEPALAKIENREITVLEIAFAPGKMPEEKSMAWLGVAKTIGELEEKYGFEYVSIIGEHPLGSKGSISHVYFTGRYIPGEQIPVGLKSVDGLLCCDSIKFKRNRGGEISASLQLGVTSYPKTKWEVRILLLDVESKEIKAVYETLENSGVVRGVALNSKQNLKLEFGKVANLGKAEKFEIRIRQITNTKPAVQVEDKISTQSQKNEGVLPRETPDITLITDEPTGAQRTKAQLIKPEIVKTSDGRAKLMYSGRYVYCRDLAKLVIEKIDFITDKNITHNEGKNQISIVCPTTGDAETVFKFLQEVDVEPIQVRMDLLVVETYSDVELDWETREAVTNITHTKTTSNAKPEISLSVPDILRESVKTEPQPENSIEKLIDLLTSRGYLKILMNPTLEVVNGKTAKIQSSSRLPTGKEIIDSFEVTPRILDDGNIDVATKMVFQNKQMGDPRTHINIKDSGSLVIGSVTKTEKRDIVRDGVKGSEERTIEVLVILTLTIITPEMNLSKKSAVQGKSQHIDVETLLNKVRQAQRPTENMIVEWQSEKPQPVFAAPRRSLKPDFSPPSRILQTYKAIIAGDKSRIEERELTFQSQKDTEPSRIREITYVFDGTMQKQLDHFVKGFENEYRGYRHTYDKNTQLLLKLLLAYPPFLDTPKLQEKYNLKVIENKEKGLIILETSKENSGIHRFTIDPDKDYNIVKQEVILPRGKDYEINCIVKKQANGSWYQVAREKIRYSAKTGKPFLENKVKITKLDFNPEIPTGAFELQFPKGIKIWDGPLKDWIIVGDEEDTSREPDVHVEGEEDSLIPKQDESSKEFFGITDALAVSDISGHLTIKSIHVAGLDGKKLISNKTSIFVDVVNSSDREVNLGLAYYTDSGTIAWFFSPGSSGWAKALKVRPNWQGQLEFPMNYSRFAKGGYVKITLARCSNDHIESVRLAQDIEVIHEKKYSVISVGQQKQVVRLLDTLRIAKGRQRLGAAEELAKYGRSVVPAITVMLQDDNVWAAHALGLIGPEAEDAVPSLIKSLTQGGDGGVRGFSASALRQIGPAAVPAIPALIGTLKDKNGNTRMHAAEALGYLSTGEKDVIEALTAALQDVDETVRKAADRSLKRIDDTFSISTAEGIERVVEVPEDYIATLPNGVTVELVGVCEHPSEGKQWWRPDGSLLKNSPYDDDFGRAFPKDGEKGYKFAVKYSGMAGKDIDARVEPLNFKTTNGGALFSTSKKNGKENMKYLDGSLDEKIVWLGAAFDEELVNCDIKIGVCFGDWKDNYRYETDQSNDAVEWVTFKNVSLKPNLKTDVQVEKEKRPLHFPDMFSVGTHYIRDPITYDWYKNWEKIGEANGQISVPAGKQVKLVISESAVGDLSFLSELGADDIQMLSFGWKAVTLGSLAPIGNLRGLKALNLQSTRFEYEDLKYLTKLDELEILRLGDYELTDESMRYIGELTSMRSLALWGTGISEEGLIHLQNLKNLTFLALNSCDITDSGLSYLKNMTDLEGLQLTQTKITGNGLSSLSHLTKLKSLLIGHNNITDEGLEKLQSLTLLENLWINNTLITDDGLAYLSDMKNLKELYASYTKISDAGLVHLKGLNDFWHLSITGIGDEGISHLSELPGLKHLQIHDAKVAKASIPYFLKMESIEKVLLSGEKINDDLLEALRAARPACKIWDPQRSLDYPMSAWRKKFEEVYRLEDNRILKRIAPPFIPERRDYYVNEHSNQASAISTSPDRFIFHWNGKLKKWGMGFTNKLDLDSILRRVLRLKSFEYDGPQELFSIELPGDWIIRDEVTQKVKLKALEQLIAEELSRTIQFEKRTVERRVIVATGSFKFHPPSETYEHESVHLYTDELDPDEGSGGGTADSVNDFILILGSLVDMPVVDHTESSKKNMVPYRHHRSSYLRKIKDKAEKASKLQMLLANLTKQTELQFRIKKRPVEVWFITEKKKDK